MKKISSLQKMRTNYDSNENVFVLHKCSKNFWRQRRIVDVYIIKHRIFHILEIVCFLPHPSVEVPRVYISSPALVELLDKEEIEEKCNARKEFFLRQRKEVDKNYIFEKVTEDLAVTYLTSKIELLSVNESHGYQIVIDNKTHEESPRAKDSVFCTKPHNLEPLVIRHHGLISTEDFHATLQKFREDSKAAKSHNEEAVCALHPGVEGLEQVLAMKLQHDRDIKLKYSRAKCRWIRAINRVVIQNCTAKIRQRLADMESKKRAEQIRLRELHHWDVLPLIGEDSQFSHRAQSRRRRQLSRKGSSSNSLFDRNSYDSDSAPTYFPTPRLSQSCHSAANSSNPALFIEKGSTVVVDPNVSPPSILHSYKEKSSSSISNLSIPWLNDSDDERVTMPSKRTILRPISKHRNGKIFIV